MHCCSTAFFCSTLIVLVTCCRAFCHYILQTCLTLICIVHTCLAAVPGTAAQPICNYCESWCRHVMRPPSSFRSPRRLERLSGLLHRSSTRRPPLPTRRPPRRPGTLPRRPEMRSAKHCLCCCWPPGLPVVSWVSSSQQSHAIGSA